LNRHEKHLQSLFVLSSDHNCHDRFASVVASIVKNNKVVSFGFNSRKTHPQGKRFAKRVECESIHAEVSAIINAVKKLGSQDLSSCTLYIARSFKSGIGKPRDTQGLAKPCQGCQKAIGAFNISKVYYTENKKGYSQYVCE